MLAESVTALGAGTGHQMSPLHCKRALAPLRGSQST